jgi:glycosyltransferase involved in cell wall biosynthesis
MDPMTWLATLLFGGNALPFLAIAPRCNSIPRLSRIVPRDAQPARQARISVVIPALNEAAGIRAGTESLLRQDYPDLEIIAVDDRSTDATGAILDAVAVDYPGRVRVVHVTELPRGWLGKNHALWLGARHATGDWLLFTDADVVYDSTAIRRALVYAQRERLDHLAMAPHLVAKGYWLNAFVAFFLYSFTLFIRPDLANDPKSRVGMGIGGFNLIRRDAYERIGTHKAISLRPDDDVRLGKRVKRSGLRQRLLNGTDLLTVHWYSSLGEAIRGLEKNGYSGVDYSLINVVGAVLTVFSLLTLPWLLLPFARGRARLLLVGTVGIHAATLLATSGLNRRPSWRYLPAFPVVALIFAYTILRAAWLAHRREGIAWRGTIYPLAELRRQTGLENLPPWRRGA